MRIAGRGKMEKSEVKILLVDDEQGVLDSLKTHLELDGYEVETASRAQDAIDMLTDAWRPFHIVMTDINMPEMDGIELLEKIKEIRGETVVIMITAYTSLMKVANSWTYGALDYVLKPFRDLSEIDTVVERAFAHLARWKEILSETAETEKR